MSAAKMSSAKSTPVPKCKQVEALPPICQGARLVCPGGCVAGTCKNGKCPFRMHGNILLGRPEVEEECRFRQRCLEKAKREMKMKERYESLNAQRKFLGMEELNEEEYWAAVKKRESHTADNPKNCPIFDRSELKTPDIEKTMRAPARPLCMLEVPPYTPPIDDYSELSRFLRISTMPGYNHSDVVSEYKDNHNNSVWNNRKDQDQHIYKFKRDWLSNWGEFNVKEQRWRKAWVEKFGGGDSK